MKHMRRAQQDRDYGECLPGSGCKRSIPIRGRTCRLRGVRTHFPLSLNRRAPCFC